MSSITPTVVMAQPTGNSDQTVHSSPIADAKDPEQAIAFSTAATEPVHLAPHHPHFWRGRHHHPTRQLKREEKVKRKIDSTLPPVLQGAETVEQAQRRLRIKNEVVAAMGEFCGTFLFLFFSYGIAYVSAKPQPEAPNSDIMSSSQLLYSSLGFGFSLAVNVWAFFRVSGGLFNPALCVALLLTKNITFHRACILLIMEFAAAIAAGEIANLLVPGDLGARSKLAPDISIPQGFFIEFIMTAQLTMCVFMLAVDKHKATFIAPVGIGLSLFIAELWATEFTGGSLNPARSLAPDVVARTFDNTAWIYYTAPFAGALLSTGVYKLFKICYYETAVEGQDSDDQYMLLRDHLSGNVTGFVQTCTAAEIPHIVHRYIEEGVHIVEPTSNTGSIVIDSTTQSKE